MEMDDSEGSKTGMEPDDDMPLLQYQRDIKLQAIAHRGNSKAESNRRRKGTSQTLNS